MFLRWVRRGSRTLDSSRRRNSTIAKPDKQTVMKIIKLGMYIKYCKDYDYRVDENQKFTAKHCEC